MKQFYLTTSRICNLFNHSLTLNDRKEILQLFETVRNSENADELSLQVINTLEERVNKFDVPYCTEPQAMALAYVIEGCL